jgi:aminoglycoside-2''-adenylyltransferase
VTAVAPDVSKWDSWRPEEVASLLHGVRAPWYVAGGWAIDLFLGEERRVHKDLEIGVPAARFAEFADVLRRFDIFVILSPHEALPVALARDRLATTHQTWVRERTTQAWRLDVFREPSDGDMWICRRESSIRLPYTELIEWTDQRIPYGRPDVILLFKARWAEEGENQSDFAAALPRLGAERQRWLREALERVHPGHSWLREIERCAA